MVSRASLRATHLNLTHIPAVLALPNKPQILKRINITHANVLNLNVVNLCDTLESRGVDSVQVWCILRTAIHGDLWTALHASWRARTRAMVHTMHHQCFLWGPPWSLSKVYHPAQGTDYLL